jgi:hypothetical protein
VDAVAFVTTVNLSFELFADGGLSTVEYVRYSERLQPVSSGLKPPRGRVNPL